MSADFFCHITQKTIQLTDSLPYIQKNENGANAHFVGTVRECNNGKTVRAIDYEVCEPLTTHILNQIAQEAIDRFTDLSVYISHFAGYLKVGEVSMLVSTSTPHRDECYRANRYLVEAIKHRCPVWKKEFYCDNSVDWVKGCKIESIHL
jgi:molybdopterin synthase catalytic subunit